MLIQVNAGEFHSTPTIISHVESEVEKSLKLFRDRVTRVEVHLRDDNGPKSGTDKRCVMEARLASRQPLAVENVGTDMYDAVAGAAGKLERAVRKVVEKEREYGAT